jgi:hypothetical protein
MIPAKGMIKAGILTIKNKNEYKYIFRYASQKKGKKKVSQLQLVKDLSGV